MFRTRIARINTDVFMSPAERAERAEIIKRTRIARIDTDVFESPAERAEMTEIFSLF